MKRTPLKRKIPIKRTNDTAKRRKPTRTSLKTKADRIFSLQVRADANYMCEAASRSGTHVGIDCSGNLQCAHIQSRRYHSIRWDFYNAISLCQAHHVYYTHEPYEWKDFIQTHWLGRWEYTYTRRRDVWDRDIDKVLEGLKL